MEDLFQATFACCAICFTNGKNNILFSYFVKILTVPLIFGIICITLAVGMLYYYPIADFEGVNMEKEEYGKFTYILLDVGTYEARIVKYAKTVMVPDSYCGKAVTAVSASPNAEEPSRHHRR